MKKATMNIALAVAITVIGLGASCSDGQGMNGVVGFGMIEPDAQDASDDVTPDAGTDEDAGEEPDVDENGQDAGVPEDISSTDTSSSDVGSEEDAQDVSADTTEPDSGTPQCVPDCDGKECGANGCGGTCGPCGAGLVCTAGQCLPVESAEDCNDGVDNDGNGKTDCEEDECKDTLECQPEPAECSSPADCDDGDICTTDSCDQATGCVHQNNNEPCEDGNLCTLNDHCSGSACLAGMPKPCADGNVNTADKCVPATGGCEHTPTEGPCDDGDPCTVQDMKQDGVCKGVPKICNDGNVCTTDSCNATSGACQHTPNTATCNDGSACTAGDKCSAGVCHGGNPVNCADGNVCTTDACDPATGCAYLNNTKSCDDGDACTEGDKCKAGNCKPGTKPLDCNDADPNTLDSCNPTLGCVHALIPPLPECEKDSDCDDGDACTAELCILGSCYYETLDCDDDDVETADSCDPTTGCVHEVLPECESDSDCDDGDLETTDTCDAGECIYTPVAPQPECLVDADCDDGDDFTEDKCLGGVCLNEVIIGDMDHDGTIACGHPDAPLAPACDCDDSIGGLIGPATMCQSANGSRFLLIKFAEVGTVPPVCPSGTTTLFTTDGSILNGPQMEHDTVKKPNGEPEGMDNDCDGQVDEGPEGASCSFVPIGGGVTEVDCDWFDQL